MMDPFDETLCKRNPQSLNHFCQSPSGTEHQPEFTDDLSKGVFTESVAIDDITRLGKCHATGDWRFFTLSSGQSHVGSEVTRKSAGIERVIPGCVGALNQHPSPFEMRPSSADARSSTRRRRYGKLNLEDMGIRPASEIPVSLHSDMSKILSDRSRETVPPATTVQSSIELSGTAGTASVPTLGPRFASEILLENEHNLESDLRFSLSSPVKDIIPTLEDTVVANSVEPSLPSAGCQSSADQTSTTISDFVMINILQESGRSEKKHRVKKQESLDSMSSLGSNSQDNSHFSYPLNGHSNFLNDQFQTVQLEKRNFDMNSFQADQFASVSTLKVANEKANACHNYSQVEFDGISLNPTAVDNDVFQDFDNNSEIDVHLLESGRLCMKICHTQDAVQDSNNFSNISHVDSGGQESKAVVDILSKGQLNDGFSRNCVSTEFSQPGASFAKEDFSFVTGNECAKDDTKSSSGLDNLDNFSDSFDISLPAHGMTKGLNFDVLTADIKDFNVSNENYRNYLKKVKEAKSWQDQEGPYVNCIGQRHPHVSHSLVDFGKHDDFSDLQTTYPPVENRNIEDKILVHSLKVNSCFPSQDCKALEDTPKDVKTASEAKMDLPNFDSLDCHDASCNEFDIEMLDLKEGDKNVMTALSCSSNQASLLSFPRFGGTTVKDQHFDLPATISNERVNDYRKGFPNSDLDLAATVEFGKHESASSASLLQNGAKTLEILFPGESTVDKSVSPDSSEVREDLNVSLLSWLHKTARKRPSSGTVTPGVAHCASSLIPVISHRQRRCSLPVNSPMTTDLKKRSETNEILTSVQRNLEKSVSSTEPVLVPETFNHKEVVGSFCKGNRSEDELDFSHSASASVVSKRGSVPAISSTNTKSNVNAAKLSASAASATPIKKRHSLAAGSSNAPVCVDEDIFITQFDQVTRINIFSSKELTERLTKIRDTLSDANLDWSKRIDVMKEVRACFFAGAKDHSDFVSQLLLLELCFQTSVRDLRSQVVREACITIAFMAQELGKEFGHFAESVLPSLISLIPNSARVMASSATICIRFILQHTHVPRLIPIITGNQTSKSSVIRKQCSEFLYQIVHTWPTHVLERHIAVLQDAIKRGIGDADSDARVCARKAFWAFSEHFKGQAESLLSSLDISKQKQLLGEQPSNSSSNTSLSSIGRSITSGTLNHRSYKSRSVSKEHGSSNGALRCSSALGRPIQQTNVDQRGGYDGGRHAQSSSAVDLVSLTATVGSLSLSNSSKVEPSRTLTNNYGSLPRPRKTSLTGGAVASTLHVTPAAERSRSRSRVSQSQPGSRSTSPAARLSYITRIQPDVVPSSHGPGNHRRTKAETAKSQGNSREASPTRIFGRERRFSGHSGMAPKSRGRQIGPQRVMSQGEVSEAALVEALHRPKTKGSSDSYDSDDGASETSSTCSDSSYWVCGRQLTEDMSEIISCLSSGAWGDRRDGLHALQNLLNNNRTLTRSELKKVTDIFSRMFHDPHGKVFSVFMETLLDLVMIHHEDLIDWLYILLTRLLSKTGADLLASVQAKVQRALEVVRSTFPSSNQFMLLSKFLIDQTQSPNLKVKVSMLLYLHGLIQLMSPSDFSNSSDIRLAVSRIITWTTEPKSVEVRKAAQAVLIALYNLNTPEFSVMLSVLPKTFQEGANRILQNRLKGSGQEIDVTPQRSGNGLSLQSTPFRQKMSSSGRLTRDGSGGALLNTEEIYNSIRQTTDDIHNLIKDDTRIEKKDRSLLSSSSFASVGPQFNALRPASESRVPTFFHNTSGKSRVKDEFAGLEHQHFCRQGSAEHENFDFKMESYPGTNEGYFAEEVKSLNSDVIHDILVELSNHNERDEERKSALLVLMKKAREEGSDVWDEYFNAVLLMLLETLGDNDDHIRAMSLRVMAEFLRCMPERFQDYVELTTMRTLECHKDPVKEVTRAAEECITLMARIVPPSRCYSFLKPLIEQEDFPVNLAAIKMFTQVIEEHQKDDILTILPVMIPGLLKGYENAQSSVRKASVVCLVAIYLVVGEALRPFLQDLHGSKVKLLNVYIKKALEENGGGGESNSCATSKASSPISMVDT